MSMSDLQWVLLLMLVVMCAIITDLLTRCIRYKKAMETLQNKLDAQKVEDDTPTANAKVCRIDVFTFTDKRGYGSIKAVYLNGWLAEEGPSHAWRVGALAGNWYTAMSHNASGWPGYEAHKWVEASLNAGLSGIYKYKGYTFILNINPKGEN